MSLLWKEIFARIASAVLAPAMAIQQGKFFLPADDSAPGLPIAPDYFIF